MGFIIVPTTPPMVTDVAPKIGPKIMPTRGLINLEAGIEPLPPRILKAGMRPNTAYMAAKAAMSVMLTALRMFLRPG